MVVPSALVFQIKALSKKLRAVLGSKRHRYRYMQDALKVIVHLCTICIGVSHQKSFALPPKVIIDIANSNNRP